MPAEDWTALEAFDLGGGLFTAAFGLGGAAEGAVAVDWTAAPTPGAADWAPCIALGSERWRLDGPGSAISEGVLTVGIRYRLAGGPVSPVSADRKALTVRPLPLPLLLAAPALAGTGKIGRAVTLDPGLWGGEPVLAVEWCRGGAAIPGATGTTYVPGPADDRTDLTARVVATNAAGSLAVVTAALPVTCLAPEALGVLPEEIFDEGTGPQEVPAAGAFRGENLSFTVTGAGASVDSTGLVLIPTAAPLSATVTVTATNSGGAAAQSFRVTVEPAEPEMLPAALAPADWSIAAIVEDPGHPGRFTAVLEMAASGPAAAAAEVYWTDRTGSDQPPFPTVPLGDRRWRMRSVRLQDDWHVRAPGETFRNLAVRYAPEPGGPTSGYSHDRKTWTVAQYEAPGPAVSIPLQPQAQIDDALRRPLTDFGDYRGAGTNSGRFGSAMVVLAAAAFGGNSSADRRLLRQLRYNLRGAHCPSGAGGFVAQHELRFAVAAAIAKLTPRIWTDFDAAEKVAIELCVKGIAVGNAFTSSDTNPLVAASAQRNLRGRPARRRGNPNFRSAAPASVHAARVFLGEAALTEFLDTFDKASFAADCLSHGLGNLYETMQSRSPPSPTDAEVQDAVRNWRYRGRTIAQVQDMLVAEVNFTFGRKVAAGLNNGAGIDGRAKIISGAADLPNAGATGMAREFDSSDAEGRRSSASYVMFGTRVALDWMTLLMCAGLLDRTAPQIQALKNRVNIGLTDLKYKSEHGYYSYAHGGRGSNNETWTEALAEEWGWDYTFGQWFDLLKPYLDGA